MKMDNNDVLSLISYIEVVILVCYAKHTSCKIAILIVYVDGIILTGSDAIEMTRLKGCPVSKFEVKDLGISWDWSY